MKRTTLIEIIDEEVDNIYETSFERRIIKILSLAFKRAFEQDKVNMLVNMLKSKYDLDFKEYEDYSLEEFYEIIDADYESLENEVGTNYLDSLKRGVDRLLGNLKTGIRKF